MFVEPLEQRRLLNGQSLLFGGIDDSAISPTNAGLVLAIELDTGRQMPLHAPLPLSGEGISGLAFTSSGELYGSTSAGPGSTSELVRIDPLTGREVSRISITAAGPISVGDLAVQPGSDVLYAVRSADDGGSAGGEIYTIDTATGSATLIGQPHAGATVDGGLAFAPDGTLFYATSGTITPTPVLHTLDPDTAAVLSTVSLVGSQGFNSGLAYWPAGDALVGSGASNGEIVRINPTTGSRTAILLDAPARGVLGDLAFQPNSPIAVTVHRADFEGSNDGYTADNTGGTFPGLWHYSLGRSGDGLLNHSTTHSWYYGRFESTRGGGRYDVFPGDHQGVVSSPLIQLPDGGASILSFSYVLNTRLPTNVDFVDVLIDNGDGDPTIIRSRQDGTLVQTGHEMWLTATADISEFNGQEIRVQFRFNTGAVPLIDPEGWYVDDVQISNFEDLATIGGTKFEDVDGNGQRDQDDPGLAGWTIFADLNENNMLDADEPSTTTDENGNYTLGVSAGVYRIREVAQTGWTQTTANPDDVTIGGGEEVLGVDFGNFELIETNGAKFNDLNGNGARDDGEPGLPGWTIFADVNENGVLDGGEPNTVTDEQGEYTLTLGPGIFRIREVLQAGWIQTTDDPADITTASGQDVSNVDFGNFALVDLSGVKFDDLNGNGNQDAGEPGLPGWTIFADLNSNGMLDEGEPNTTTDEDGNYTLTVGPGTFRIREVLQAGWIQITDNPADITTASGQEVPGVDFGNFAVVDISGVKFDDLNANGFRDDEEPGLPGWTIFADLNDNGMLDDGEPSTTTDEGGNYTLTVGPGTFRIREVLQAGWIQITDNPADITVSSGQDVPGVDFGNAQVASIGGQVWIDLNGNTVIDENLDGDGNGEAGIPNVTIRLLDASMTVLDTRFTSSTVMDVDGDGADDPIGSYYFGTLTAGNYLVDVVETTVPAGYSLTTGFDPLPVVLGPAQQGLANFGYQSVIQFATALGFFRPEVPEEFAFVPFVRPSDQPLLNLLEDPNRELSDYLAYLTSAATNPQSYQVLEIANTASELLTVTSIDVLLASPGSAEFVTFYTEAQLQELIDLEAELVAPLTGEQIAQLKMLLEGVTDPSEIAPIPGGESITLFAFYQPVVRNPDGTVDTQFPEWYDDPLKAGNQTLEQQGAAHTFDRNDLVQFTTQLDGVGAGPIFQYQFVGGSTFDSDIDYDGRVTLVDFGIINDILLQAWPTTPGDALWDPTTDINVRFPNGSGNLAGLLWPLTDPKEIGMGDFGPLNVEIVRGSRAPFLDLDADNDSQAAGVDYATVYSGTPVKIAGDDARFGNAPDVTFDGLQATIQNGPDGANEQLAVDTLGTTIVVASNEFQGGRWVLTLSGNATVESYLSVLATITYTNNSATPTPGVRVIEVSALGSSEFVYEQAGQTIDQRQGNAALAKVAVEPAVAAIPVAAAAAAPAADEFESNTSAAQAVELPSAKPFEVAGAVVEPRPEESPPAATVFNSPSVAPLATPLPARPTPLDETAGMSQTGGAESVSNFQIATLVQNLGTTFAGATQFEPEAVTATAASDVGLMEAMPSTPTDNALARQAPSAEITAAWWLWTGRPETAGDSISAAEGSGPTNVATAAVDHRVAADDSTNSLATGTAATAMPELGEEGDAIAKLDAVFSEAGSDDEMEFLLP